jgi:ribose transport system ATP-binding protein
MDEIFEIAYRITVLRAGEVQCTVNTSESTIGELTNRMIGRELDQYFHRAKAEIGAE